MDQLGIRTYIAEPNRRRRRWGGRAREQKRLYGNRRRLRGARSKGLHRKRAELTERTSAHLYETGRMRRLHLRGSQNILKRLLVHGAAFDLGLLMRKTSRCGHPAAPERARFSAYRAYMCSFQAPECQSERISSFVVDSQAAELALENLLPAPHRGLTNGISTTGC